MGVPPDQPAPPPPTIDDEHDASVGPQDATVLPWPQTRWSAGQSSNASIQDRPMCKHFYPEVQANDGSDESEDFEEFDDATPHRSQEGKAGENAHAQGNDDMDGASSASSHEGPPQMIDSEDEDDERLRDRYVDKYAEDTEDDDEDEEIELLPRGIIPSDDDDLDGFVRRRKQGDLEAVCSRGFGDSTLEARALRHLATRKPKLRSCDTCRRAKALRARRIRTSKKARRGVRKFQGPIPEKSDQVTLDHVIARNERNLGFAKQTNVFACIRRAIHFRWGKGFRKKTGVANLEAMRKLQGPDPKDKIKHIYSDAAPEIRYATKALGIRSIHDTSAPGDSQGNEVAENNNRDIKMGAAALPTHAGMPLWRCRVIASDAMQPL
jgi:hypothetical protein